MSLNQIFLDPWTQTGDLYGWILLMASLVSLSCSWLGCFLLLRRMALMGDAISHAVLPGIVLAFLWSGSLQSQLALWLGAVGAGLVGAFLIETLHARSRLKEDAALGIVLTAQFALGMVLISVFASRIDLDPDCVLYGELAFIPLRPYLNVLGYDLAPLPVVTMGGVTLALAVLGRLFYRPLLLSSFDPLLGRALGLPAPYVHYALMVALSITVVSAFEAVGAVLVVAMLILPAASAFLLAQRLPTMLGLASLHAFLSSLLGLHLAIALDCSIAAAMVVAGAGLFGICWIFALLRRRTGRLSVQRQAILALLEREPGPLEVVELARLGRWEVPPLLTLLGLLEKEGKVLLGPRGVRLPGEEVPSSTQGH